jgi:hypothetical protein
MKGDKASWKLMKDYNKQDVVLLEKIYLHFRPWMRSHPNMGMYAEDLKSQFVLSAEAQDSASWRYVNNTTTYMRFQCQVCGGWGVAVNTTKGLKVVNA